MISGNRLSRDKVQLFVFSEYGIGQVYDHRPNRPDRSYDGPEIKFPSGFGWQIDKPRSFSFSYWVGDGAKRVATTTIKITAIHFDQEGVLDHLKYEYYWNHIHDHTYMYKPNQGMVEARKQ